MRAYVASTLIALAIALPAHADEFEILRRETLRKENLEQAAEVADRIYRTVGDNDTVIIGIGRSPTIFVEMLREKYDFDTDYLPMSRVKNLTYDKIYNGLDAEEQMHLDRYFAERLAPWLRHKKRIVFLDCSGSGISIRFMARELSRFVAKYQFPVEVIMGSIESPSFQAYIFPTAPYFRIVSRDRVKTSFRVTPGNESSNLLTSVATGRLDWFAPHWKLDIRGLLKNGAPPVKHYETPDSQLFLDLQKAIRLHVARDPLLKPWLKRAHIYRPNEQGIFRRIRQNCSSVLNRLRQNLLAKLPHSDG